MANLNVRYRFGSARKAEIERYPAGWRGFRTRIVRVPYTEGTLVLDLRNLTPADAKLVAGRIESAGNSNDAPREDVPYHDLYWSEARLLRWPD